MSVSDPCLTRSRGPFGDPVVRLGMPLVDDYLEFLAGRCRSNTVLAAGYDLRVFFSVVGKPILPIGVMGSPFGEAVPVCPDGTLIQRAEQGEGVAHSLGKGLAVILQGHGAVIVGASVEEAFVASVLLEDNAVRQYRAAMIGTPRAMEREELKEARRQVWNPKVVAKIWTYYQLKAQAQGILN